MKRPGLELRLLHAMAEPGAQQDKFHPDPQLPHQGPGKEAAKNCLKTDKTPHNWDSEEARDGRFACISNGWIA